MRSFLSATASVLALASPLAAFAQTTPPSTETVPALADKPPQKASPKGMTVGLTGDWGGKRDQLFDDGIDFQLGFANQFVSNVAGVRKGVADNGQALIGTNLDMDKLAGIRGGKARVLVIVRYGHDLNIDKQLGLIQNLQSNNGRGNIPRLTEAWYEQSLAGGKLSLRVGREPTGLEFGTSTCDSQNRAFCGSPPGNLPDSYTYWLSYPSSTWMARARLNLGANNKLGYLQTGVYQTNPDQNADRDHGFKLGLKHGTGVLIPLEFGLTPDLWAGHPGIYKIGGWVETSQVRDIFEDDEGNPIVLSGKLGKTMRGRHGIYFEARQQLTPSSKGVGKAGLSVFLNMFKFDDRTSKVDNYIGGGLIQTGTFASRPDDQLAIEFSRTHVNSRLADADRLLAQTDPLQEVRGSEYATELDYRIAVTRGLRIIPNVQYVVDPGGYANHHDVLAFGMMTNVLF